jgi:hypothetical protein
MEITNELILDKVWQLFPGAHFDEAIAILDGYESEEPHLAIEWTQVCALKMSNGKLDRLRAYIQMAHEDPRDLWLVAREPNTFRVGMTSGSPRSDKDYKTATRKDEEQFTSWLQGNHFMVCEGCSGVGIVPVRDTDQEWKLPDWIECTECKGTGIESEFTSTP